MPILILIMKSGASRFITNQGEFLRDLLKSYLPSSKTVDCLTGYFYFSGFLGVYEAIGERPLRVLVGMDAGVDVHNCLRETLPVEPNRRQAPLSKLKIRNAWQEGLREVINKADSLDTGPQEKAFRFFIEKVKNNTLEVRKTKEPAHGKMYVFTYDDAHNIDGRVSGMVLVGSSNLSFPGLQSRTEVNVELRDEHDYNDAATIFETLWDEAIPLVNPDTKDEFFEKVIKRTWLEKYPSPYLMYVRVLDEYFKVNAEEIKTPHSLTAGNETQYLNLAYQTEAISDALHILKRHSGCLVADVVGLGKSIIAVTAAVNLNIKTIIISPPHLKSQWEDFAFDFGLRSFRIYTPGKLRDCLGENPGAGEKLIIIDEAHRYRNENTEAYGLLHKICIGNKVLLLSATPFNNRPDDIFSLLKLFQIPAHSTIQTVNNLGGKMEDLILEYKKLKKGQRAKTMSEAEFRQKAAGISSEIRDLLQPVLIRRTRVDLQNTDRYRQDLAKQGIQFSDVSPPEEQDYALGDMSALYLDTLEKLTGKEEDGKKSFTAARYKPLLYLKPDAAVAEKYRKIFDNSNFQEGQRNLSGFMRQMLVRRFESSVFAFKKTLQNLINSMENIKKWYAAFKKIPIYKRASMPDFDSLETMVNDEMDSALFYDDIDDVLNDVLHKHIEKGLVMVEAGELNGQFILDIESDIALFTQILSDWNSPTYRKDPKATGIISRIKQSIKKDPKRKIIIFSEFKDTADYLETQFLENNVRALKYTSEVASTNRRKEVKVNFDAGVAEEFQKNDYDVLIATDAISEGFSLHRAGTIYNYDIPYNPTRVIQRVGRINRINKKVFDKLNIYNYFPTATGEVMSRTKEITTFKMLLIQTIFGSDTKILTADEITEGYFTEAYLKAKAEAESPSWDTEYRNELDRTPREIIEAARELPQRCRTGRKREDGPRMTRIDANETMENSGELFDISGGKGVLLFSRKGDAYRFSFTSEAGQSRILSANEGLACFKADPAEKPLEVTGGFYPLYEAAKHTSGIAVEKTTKSKNIMELDQKMKYLKKQFAPNSTESGYLTKIEIAASSLDSLPAFYVRELLGVSAANPVSACAAFKAIVNEEYMDAILEKDNTITNEPETILLSEQFLEASPQEFRLKGDKEYFYDRYNRKIQPQ